MLTVHVKYICVFLVLSSCMLTASNVDIALNSPIYQEIERLETLGELKSLVATSKPYNTTELYNAVNKIDNPKYANDKEALLLEIARYKKDGLVDMRVDATLAKNAQTITNKSGITTTDSSAFYSNMDGMRLDNGVNIKAQGRSQYAIGDNLSVVITPLYENSGSKQDVGLGDTYARANVSNINLTVGRESLWIGVGKGGTIILGNNAKPINMARVSNIEPFEILPQSAPWLSSIIGKMDSDFFIGRLDNQNNILGTNGTFGSGYPKIFGMQLSFKPTDNFQWGLYRTALFGGGGRSDSFGTFADAFWPSGDADNTGTPNEPGDQKAGGFAKLNVPNSVQPFSIYSEIVGEDAAGMTPSKNSFLTGLTLVDIADVRGLSATYEYFKAHDSDALYRHHLYRDGYTNDGIIMGHPHGGQGDSHYLGVVYQPNMDSTISFAYAHDTYSGYNKSDSFMASCRGRIDKNYEMGANAGYTNSNFNNENYYISLGAKALFFGQ